MSEASESIEVLEAEIEKSDADISRLASEISDHAADAEAASAEKQAATKLRETERADFKAALMDYSESIDAIGRATRELKSKSKKDAATALVQLKALQLPETASRGLQALLSEGATKKDSSLFDSLDLELTPDTDAYQFQSGGVVGMLEKLQDKFVDERVKLEKEEITKKHAYELLAQSLDTKIAQANKQNQQKTTFKAKKMQEKAAASSDLAETKESLEVDKSYSSELSSTCRKKASDFKERQKVRGEELEAIQKAVDTISGLQASGSLLQASKPGTALAMLRADGKNPSQAQVARFLQKEAAALNSRVLSALAARAEEDPLAKVKAMIEGLITRLAEQATEETTKKAWCDKELATNKATREDKTNAVDSLQAEVDEMKANVEKLGEDTAALSKEITELTTAMSEAMELRQKEKFKNEATVKDCKDAQAAVAQAVMVLKDFYAKAGEALLQTGAKVTKSKLRAPDIFGDDAYTGMQGAKGGVVGLLEVIEADFARLEAETMASEAASKKEHDSLMEESKISKAEKSKEVEHKTSTKQHKSSELVGLEADLQNTQKELDASMAYFETLKPECLDAGDSYAERKARREQEIKDLQEALSMLSSM
eukprot:TRINITY_DN99164_c0_g1_i1.p1 TRINITY_DN99164_c0_g1~~TRINITY_DN99164_c0_g1_i1.p1  ORF type:complete len:688 (-),score=260.27 TRINITY_DN99164_c0_g1_i1:56-1864(-)